MQMECMSLAPNYVAYYTLHITYSWKDSPMADEEEKGTENEDELDLDEAPGGKKKMMIIVIAAVLLIGGGAGAYFGGLFGGGEDAPAAEVVLDENGEPIVIEQADGEEEAGEGDGGEEVAVVEKSLEGPVYYALPEFLVNLNTGGKGVSFLKATIVLEVGSAKIAEKVTAVEPRIVDGFNTYLLELRSTDLVGSAGLYRLREEMMMRVNKAIYPDKVDDILFKEIIVQ